MNARPMLSDHALEAMLARRAGRARVDDLPEVIVMAVSTEPVPRRRLFGRPGWLRRPVLVGRPALVAALLVLAAAAAAFAVGAWLLLREPPPKFPLQPTGLQAMAITWEPIEMVPDANGGTWVQRQGGLARFDAAGRPTGQWSIADDRALVPNGIAADPDGGVWIWQGAVVRHFDGRGFTDVVEAGAPVSAVSEAPDGSLWLVAGDGRVLAWDGATLEPRWTRTTEGAALHFPQTARPFALAVSPTGEVWATFGSQDGPTVIGRYDGAAWRYFGREDGVILVGSSELAIGADGTPWLFTPDEYDANEVLLRFDGAAWQAAAAPPDGARALVIGPGGVPWVIAGDWQARQVSWLDGATWRDLWAEDGIPASTWVLAAAGDDVLVATADGLGRIRDGRFMEVWRPSQAGVEGFDVVGGGSGPAWVSDGRVVTPHASGTWGATVALPDIGSGSGVGTDADASGRLWAWGSEGIAVREGDAWRVVDTAPADRIELGPDGDAWVLTQSVYDEAGFLTEQPSLRHLVASAGGWDVVDRITLDQDPAAFAVGPAGRLLVAGGFASSLQPELRLRKDGAWVDLPPASDDGMEVPGSSVVDAAFSPSGDLWVFSGIATWGPPLSLSLSVLRDGTWTVYTCGADEGAGTALPACGTDSGTNGWLSYGVGYLAFGPDRSVWFAGNGLARFNGATWASVVDRVPLHNPVVADDGSVWAISMGTILRYVPEN